MDRKDVVYGIQVDPNKPHEQSVVDAISITFVLSNVNLRLKMIPPSLLREKCPPRPDIFCLSGARHNTALLPATSTLNGVALKLSF